VHIKEHYDTSCRYCCHTVKLWCVTQNWSWSPGPINKKFIPLGPKIFPKFVPCLQVWSPHFSNNFQTATCKTSICASDFTTLMLYMYIKHALIRTSILLSYISLEQLVVQLISSKNKSHCFLSSMQLFLLFLVDVLVGGGLGETLYI